MAYNPKISIIIPVYNVGRYLTQCLNSIISQKYSNLEIIVINDGSTDDSLKIIEEFDKKDSRIKFIDQENKGLSETRNFGLELVSGDYVMFVDGDDWIDVDYFSSFISHVREEIELVVGSYSREFRNKSIERNLNLSGVYESEEIQRRLIGLIDHELVDPSQADSIVTAWSKLYKNKIIKENTLRFKSTKDIGTEDLLFNIEYLNQCRNKVYVINQPLYKYRKDNVVSLTSNYKKDFFLKWKKLFVSIEPFCNTPVKEQALYNRICLSIIGLGLTELKNPKGRKEILLNLKMIFSDSLYRAAFSKLELRYFPKHWKLFFFCAKYRIVIGVYFMLLGINYFINKNN